MNREDWLNIKKTGQYTVESLYYYWLNNKKPNYKEISIEEFANKMENYLMQGGNVNRQKIDEFLDKTFHILKIYDKEKNLIQEL